MPDLIIKALSDAEQVKLRHLLNSTPAVEPDEFLGAEYPKMLYHESYLDLYQIVKGHKDPLAVKEAREMIRTATVVVLDFEEEEEYLRDGWVAHPADLYAKRGMADPRIPVGREGRRAEVQNKASRDEELRALKRRFIELTGGRIEDAVVAPVAAKPVNGAKRSHHKAKPPAPTPALPQN